MDGRQPDALAHLIAKTPAEERVGALITPSVEALGYHLVRLRMMGAGGRGKAITLQIMAERPDGTMEIDDCAALSEAVSAVLDVEDPIEGEYTLEVSSPGIDRPLTRAADLVAHEGHLARVEMLAALDGRKRYRGLLRGLAGGGDTATLELETEDQGVVSLPLRDIGDAKLLITDALIAESLRRQKAPSAEGADEIIEYGEGPDGPTNPREGDA